MRLILLAALLSGCAANESFVSDHSDAQRDKDYAECHELSKEHVSVMSWAGPFKKLNEQITYRARCMKDRGYSW